MALEYLRAHCSRIGRPGCCRNSVDSWLPAQFRPSYSAKWRSRQIGARPAKPILPSRSLPESGSGCPSKIVIVIGRERASCEVEIVHLFNPAEDELRPLRRHHQVRQRVDQRI